jgi:hypothetical protein
MPVPGALHLCGACAGVWVLCPAPLSAESTCFCRLWRVAVRGGGARPARCRRSRVRAEGARSERGPDTIRPSVVSVPRTPRAGTQRDQRSHRFVIKHSLESFRLLASKKLLLSLLVPARLAARRTHTIEVYPHPHRIQPTKSTSFVAPLCGEGPSSGSLCALEKSKPLTSYGT